MNVVTGFDSGPDGPGLPATVTAHGPRLRAVSRVLPGTPAFVYAAVSDVVRTSAYSPELVAMRWVKRARTDQVSVGDRFESRNETMGMSWSAESVVVDADVGHRFRFVVGTPENPTATWTFTLTPVPTGTEVTYQVKLGDGPSMFGEVTGGDVSKRAAAERFRLDALATDMAGMLDGLAADLAE